MDEPLSNLDAKLRVATRAEIAALQRNLGITTLYVTHDQVEAMTMGDRVAVMKDGVLQQCDTPRALYDHPANVFVAGFIGTPPMNLLSAVVEEGGLRIGGTTLELSSAPPAPLGARITVGLRPEALELSGPGNALPAVVTVVEELGAEALVYATLVNGRDAASSPANLVVRVAPDEAPAKADVINVAAKPGTMLYFDPGSGERVDAYA
jgi:multiple sugar transport system ATP-binding protein